MGRGSKQTTHEDILNATRRLFTESGYNNVSMRDIAGELGISVGNLTYYYKNKAELIEAAILDKHEKFRQEGSQKPASTLKELDTLLQRSQKLQEEHLYYYRQYSQLSEATESIRELQHKVYRELEQIWIKTLENLRSAGLMKEEMEENQTALLISTVLFVAARWHERDTLDRSLGIETPDFRSTLWALLLPLLTKQGREIYRDMMEESAHKQGEN